MRGLTALKAFIAYQRIRQNSHQWGTYGVNSVNGVKGL
jgi:hypothetical protein